MKKNVLSLSCLEDEEAILLLGKKILTICLLKKKEEIAIFKDYKINTAKLEKSYTLKTSDFDK